MGKFLNGLFVGFGIGLFIAPQTGEETRRMIMERVIALRKSMSSEEYLHLPIDARPLQIPPLPTQPAQSATEVSSEPQVQGISSESATRPIASVSSEPQVRGISSESPVQPTTEFFSESEGQETSPEPAAQPIATVSSKSEEQGISSTPPAEAPSMLSNQSADVSGNTRNIADTAQMSGSTNTDFVPDRHPGQQTPTETPRTDTVITEALPISGPSNVPGRTARRKASTRTSNTGKSRGHSK